MTIMSQPSLLADAPASIADLVKRINDDADAKTSARLSQAAANLADRRITLAEELCARELSIATATAKTAAKAAKDASKTKAQIAHADADVQRWQAKAVADEKRITNPHGKVALTKKISARIDYALYGMVAVGIGISALNIQRTVATDGAADPLAWLAFGMEAMVSVPIVVTMVVASLGMRLGRSFNRKPFAIIEGLLLVAAVALNVLPHALAGDLLASVQFGSVPALMAVSVALHGFVSALLSTWTREAAVEASREREITKLAEAYAA
ncbi:hypothetical protein [Nocardia sp. NPDC051570]|uniref:hypothetical protein n=1 Tax=Nocardia sp. NPDC051570 TaxID=3364324 RepID=UPI0037A908C2